MLRCGALLVLGLVACARSTPDDASDAAPADAPVSVDVPVLDAPVVDASSMDASMDSRVSAMDVVGVDAPSLDVRVDDASVVDAPVVDASVVDAGVRDAAPVDAGCDHGLPAGWPSAFAPWAGNPVLLPRASTTLQGADNVYAPELRRLGEARLLWYGAQGGDGHDRIYLAVAHDGAEWRRWPTDADPQPVLDRGTSNHVNDPSVVRAGSTWRMYYTDAATAENDRIWLAESAGATAFVKVREVLGTGAPGAWDAEKVGRPSVILEGGVYRMWYDGTAAGRRSVGLATSTDGVNFVRHPANPLFLDAGAVDVERVGDTYVMLREGGDGTYWATSPDGLCWTDRGRLFARSGAAYDAFGQVTPFLEVEGGAVRGVWFGGASVSTWNRNRIALALPAGAPSPGPWGCTACVAAGVTCTEACVGAGGGRSGSCAVPGSTVEGRCCACADDGCGACTAAADCHAACVSNGAASGWCAAPGSSDPSHCCSCVP